MLGHRGVKGQAMRLAERGTVCPPQKMGSGRMAARLEGTGALGTGSFWYSIEGLPAEGHGDRMETAGGGPQGRGVRALARARGLPPGSSRHERSLG